MTVRRKKDTYGQEPERVFFPDCEQKAKDCNVFETFLIEVNRFLAVRSERDKNRWA